MTGIGASQKTWFTARELAELDLPGLPAARNRVVELVARERWAEKFDAGGNALSRPRQGRGGGLEFHHTLLPAPAALKLRQMGLLGGPEATLNPVLEAPQAAPEVATWAWYEAQSAKTKADAQARLKIIQAVEAARAAGLGQNAAVARAAAESGIAASSIWSWLGLLKGVEPADRLPALAPRRRGGGVKVDMDAELWSDFKSRCLSPSFRTFAKAWHRTKLDFAHPAGLDMPKIKTLIRKFEREVPREVVVLQRQGMKAYLETFPSQTRSVAGMHAMQLVNIDGHTIDVFVTPPEGGKPIRATLIGMQDVYSRKMLAWRMCGEESIFHTRLCFADLFEKWGIPEGVLMDNGRAFASKYLTSGTKTRFRYVTKDTDPWGLLPSLGIVNHFATPEHGQAKPIERGFGDLVGFIAQDEACIGAYTGNSPMNKPHNYGQRAMAWAELSALVDARIAEYNAYVDRNTEMAKGRSFDAVFAESYAVHGRGAATDEQVAMALLEAGTYRADRKTGEIRIHGNRYYDRALYDLAGQELTVRFDPDNLHKPIHVYTLTGAKVCVAAVIAATGFLDTEAAKVTAKARADARRLGRELVKAENLVAATELARRSAPAPVAEIPDSPILRPVRRRGHSAAALKLIQDQGAQAEGQRRHAYQDLFTDAVARLSEEPARPRFTILDGGLTASAEFPSAEPERPQN